MKKLKEKQKKFLGTVPKKCQLVETFWDCPEISKTRNKGITLIALIITIIVMLILVGVTINVALNGGIFEKAKYATFKTKISQIQEALLVKKAELVAGNNGKEPPYNLTINDLDISNELKNEYGSKLIIGTDGKLYYDSTVVTNTKEQNDLKEQGVLENEVSKEIYSFTLNQMNEAGAFEKYSDGLIYYNKDIFWQTVGQNLSGLYGFNMQDGSIIGKMSTDSETLSFYSGVYVEGKFELLFAEQENQPIIMIVYYTEGSAQGDYFDTNGRYDEILNRFGNVTIYFGEK